MKTDFPDYTPDSVIGLVSQYQKIRVLLTAYELGIFSILDKSTKTSAQVAGRLKTDSRATDRLLNALCAIGFLIKRNEKFGNTAMSARYLVKGKPEYMSGLMHTANSWHTWSTLTESVRDGTSVYHRPENINDRDGNWLESFIAAMHYRARGFAGDVVSKIDLRNVRTVLDVGGGSGIFAMEFTKAGKSVTATVLDLPNVIPIAKKYIRKEKLQGRVFTQSGDFKRDRLPRGFDIVFLSAIVHMNSNEENVKLIKKCAASLNPGGRVVILDHVMEENRVLPARGAMFALNMLVGTKEGDTYTLREMKGWFEKAGLSFQKKTEVQAGALVIAKKK
jgi:2-polyprenyl-3-methyl-5-hydroxy-6-metoxy-1,4-benzoquinol methylase